MTEKFRIILFVTIVAGRSFLFAQDSLTAPGKNERAQHASWYTAIGVRGGVDQLQFRSSNYGLKAQLGKSGGFQIQQKAAGPVYVNLSLSYHRLSFTGTRYPYDGRTEFDFLRGDLCLRPYLGKRQYVFVEFGLSAEQLLSTKFSGPRNYHRNESHLYLQPMAGIGARVPLTSHISVELEGKGLKPYARRGSSYGEIVHSLISPEFYSGQIGVNYEFSGERIESKRLERERKNEQEDSTLKKYTGRLLFVKVFYAPQGTSALASGPRTSVQDSYYGNSHTTYFYDGTSPLGDYGQEFGFSLEFNTREHFNFNLGLSYDQLSFHTKPGKLSYAGWGDFLGSYSGTYPGETSVRCVAHYVSFPAVFNFVVRKENSTFYAGAGPEVKKLIYSRVELGPSKFISFKLGQETSNNERPDPLNLFAIANIGVSTTINDKISCYFEPFYKMSVGAVNFPVAGNSAHFWAAGCKAGLKF